MKTPVLMLLLPVVCLTAAAQTTVTVGSGAPTPALQQSFIRAYFKNGFNNLVVSPPIGNVKSLGTLGLVQEFTDAKVATNKYALCKPNINAPTLANDADMVQFYPALYAYYSSVGVATAGYPTSDTTSCPTLAGNSGNSCQYQTFDKPYVLFVYSNPLTGGATNFPLLNPIYTKWLALGALATGLNGGPGPATSASTAITSASGIAATYQSFDQGAVFIYTSGTLTGRTVGVTPGVYPTYAANGGYTGFLGLPVADEQLLATGRKRQTFENGSIEYDPTGATPAILRYPVTSILVSPAVQTLRLNLGDSVTLTATPYDPNGLPLTDRAVVWTTSNAAVVAIKTNGASATFAATGGGTATLYATSEAKSSQAIVVTVNAPCCSVGQGAPTPSIQQAFLDAVTRGRLTLQLPTAQPVTRAGSGYIQAFQDVNGVPYLIAIADKSAAAYVVSGALYAKYASLGGPSGPLGYPAADANANGRQLFLNQAALAGAPVQLVAAPILSKWAALGYETGAAGNPTSSAAAVLSFRATQGTVQSFTNAAISATGSSAYLTAGLVQAAYAQSGGALGSLGLPLSDETASNGKRRQDFEGGFIDYTPGDAAAAVHPTPRQPVVTATPSNVLAGTRLRLAVGGFDPGAAIRVSVTGQTDFTVTAASGAYVWDSFISAAAKAATVTVTAVDANNTAVKAAATYIISTAAQLALTLTKSSGDAQTGLPGALLAQPLDLLVKDATGAPIAGIPVAFAVSPGAALISAATSTNDAGHATAFLRLPAAEGLSLISVTAGKSTATFSAQAQRGSLANFPKQTQSAPPAGNFTAALSSILRYYQNSGALPSPSGFSDPNTLAQFLTGLCVPNANGGQICDGFLTPPDTQDQIPNAGRLAAFVSGNLDISVDPTDLPSLRDFVSQGTPVLLALTPNGQPTAFAVATGVDQNGNLTLADPNPATNYTVVPGGVSITGAMRLIVRTPSPRAYMLSGNASAALFSQNEANLNTFTINGLGGNLASFFKISVSAGAQDFYQLDVTSPAAYRLLLTNLSNPSSTSDISGSGAASLALTRVNNQWTAAPQSLNFAAAGVVDAASFSPNLAPGEIVSIFGTGLAAASSPTTVQIDGQPATVVAQSPFQISAALPLDLAPGAYPLTVTSPYGRATQTVALSPTAPAIFQIGNGLGAIVNQDGTLNGPASPIDRGQVAVVYCTGLGAVTRQGNLQPAAAPVTATLGGFTLKPSYAGLTPGFIGLYQVNLPIPASTVPGLNIPLTLQQNGAVSAPVPLSVQ